MPWKNVWKTNNVYCFVLWQQGTKETMVHPRPAQDGVEGGTPPSGTDG